MMNTGVTFPSEIRRPHVRILRRRLGTCTRATAPATQWSPRLPPPLDDRSTASATGRRVRTRASRWAATRSSTAPSTPRSSPRFAPDWPPDRTLNSSRFCSPLPLLCLSCASICSHQMKRSFMLHMQY